MRAPQHPIIEGQQARPDSPPPPPPKPILGVENIARPTAQDERDRWIRLFNRLQGAIQHHRNAKSDAFVDEVDEALYAAHDRVLREAARKA